MAKVEVGFLGPGVATEVPILAESLLEAPEVTLLPGVAPGWLNLVPMSLTRPWFCVLIFTMEDRPHCGASAWVTFLKNSEASIHPSVNCSLSSSDILSGFLMDTLDVSSWMSGMGLLEMVETLPLRELVMLELDPMELRAFSDGTPKLLFLVSDSIF